MSGRSAYVTGSYAKERITKYINFSKNKLFRIKVNGENYHINNKQEFTINLLDKIKDEEIYYLDIDDYVIELETEEKRRIVTNDEEWEKYS